MLDGMAAQKGTQKITPNDFSRRMVHARKHVQKCVVYIPCQGAAENAEYGIIGDALCLVIRFLKLLIQAQNFFC